MQQKSPCEANLSTWMAKILHDLLPGSQRYIFVRMVVAINKIFAVRKQLKIKKASCINFD